LLRLPAPGHCIGREREVDLVISVLLEEHPLPLPILGGPGMVKATIALNALHDKRLTTRFGRAWFVRGEGVNNRTEPSAASAGPSDHAEWLSGP
jgi:hypothetical protein